jgi:hypothetical protein
MRLTWLGHIRLYEAGNTYDMPRALAHAAAKRNLVALEQPMDWEAPSILRSPEVLIEAELAAAEAELKALHLESSSRATNSAMVKGGTEFEYLGDISYRHWMVAETQCCSKRSWGGHLALQTKLRRGPGDRPRSKNCVRVRQNRAQF